MKSRHFFCSTDYHKKLSRGIANEVEMMKTKRIYDQKEDSDGTRILYYLHVISIRKHLESDDESANLVTNWMLESNFSSEEFEDYHQALSMFNNISKDGTQIILYEIKKSPVDGSIVKKTPLLNSKKAETKSRSFKRITYRKSGDKSDDHPKKKNKFKDFKVRIFLLIIVFLTFIAIMFFMNSIAGESSNVTTVHQSILFRIDNPSYFLHL